MQTSTIPGLVDLALSFLIFKQTIYHDWVFSIMKTSNFLAMKGKRNVCCHPESLPYLAELVPLLIAERQKVAEVNC